MAKDTFTGPLIALGGLAGGSGASAPREYSDEIGPSIFWSGMAIPATGGPGSKDRMGPGAISSVFAASPIRTVNAALSASNGGLTIAGLPTAGVPLPNITAYVLGRAPGVPVVGPGGIPTTGVALDAGLDSANFNTAGTVILTTVANAWRYRVGQWICLLNSPASGAQMTQITAITLATGTLNVSPPPVATIAGQIALTNRYNPNFYGASGPPSSISSMAAAGSARIVIPELGNARGVGVTAAAATVNGPVLILGTDIFGNLTSELITTVAGATAWGKKTYDIFISATPQFTDATAGHNLTVVTSDLISLPLSVMSADSIVAATLGGTALVAGTNFTIVPADLTMPATQTTGDPRGGIQTTANGPATPPGTPSPFTGTVLTVDQRLNPLQVALATVINPGSLLGVAPA